MTLEVEGVNTPNLDIKPNGDDPKPGEGLPNPILDDPNPESVILAIKADLERLKSTNARLLEESKRYKQQKREVDLKLLEAEGKKDEIIATLQKELEEKQAILSEQKERDIQQRITNAVAQRAAKYGCEDWDHLMLLGKSDLIEFDEQTGDVKGVDLFFEDALRNERFKKFFLKMDKVKTHNKTPNASPEMGDWKNDPLPYLMKLKKEKKMGEYAKAKKELEDLGLLKKP